MSGNYDEIIQDALLNSTTANKIDEPKATKIIESFANVEEVLKCLKTPQKWVYNEKPTLPQILDEISNDYLAKKNQTEITEFFK